MRKLTFLVVLVAAIYSGYWFVGARAVENGAISAIKTARADGWQIAYGDLNTRGFPSRFDTTIKNASLTEPNGLWSWQVPFLQVFALSYQPNKLIAAFPETQTLQIADQTFDIASQGLRASAGVKANTDLSFDATTVEVGPATVRSSAGWTASLSAGLVAMRAMTDSPRTYDFYADLSEITLPVDLARQLDPTGQLGDTVTHFVLSASSRLDRALDRHGFDQTQPPPAPEMIKLTSASITWGDVSLQADGEIEIDTLGVPEGRITFRTAQWREMIDLLTAAGIIQPGIAPTVMNVARGMAQGNDTLALPLSFQNGFMSIGPLPLGPAPRLR